MEALLEGKSTPAEIAQLAQRSAKKKIPQIRAAIEGHCLTAMQRKLIGFSLDHMAFPEEQILELDNEVATHIRASELQRQHQILQTIPGVKQEAASGLLAEFGPDTRKVFGSGAKCSSWAGAAPGNNESAGRKKRAPALRAILG
jgi:transposase